MHYQNYDKGREKMKMLIRRLNTYKNTTHTFDILDEDEEFGVIKD